MRKGVIFQMEVPYREPLRVRGFEFGSERGARSCAIVGSTRGNEVQQDFICARLVAQLADLERRGMIVEDKSVLVMPCINPFSMNVQRRFWPLDRSDVNRSFPGSPSGETTERLADAVLRIARTYSHGIQLCSFNQPGDFLPHVRLTHQGPITEESLVLARDFGLPYVLRREPAPFDETTLNYAWQQCGTHAFSLYSRATDYLDTQSAKAVTDAVLRYLRARGILKMSSAELEPGAPSEAVRESDLLDLRTEHSSGFLVAAVRPGDRVRKGQKLAQVLDAYDTHVLETLQTPVNGRVFFMRTDALVQQHMVVLRIVPE